MRSPFPQPAIFRRPRMLTFWLECIASQHIEDDFLAKYDVSRSMALGVLGWVLAENDV